MCVGIPVKIIEVVEGHMAVADIGGARQKISIELLEDVGPGDYVIVHVGHAITKLDPEEAAKTLALFAEIGRG